MSRAVVLAVAASTALAASILTRRTRMAVLESLEYRSCEAVAPLARATPLGDVVGVLLLVPLAVVVGRALVRRRPLDGRLVLATAALAVALPVLVAGWEIYWRSGLLGTDCSDVWASSPWPWSVEVVLLSGLAVVVVVVAVLVRISGNAAAGDEEVPS